MSNYSQFVGGDTKITDEIYPVGSIRQIGSSKPEIEFDGGSYLRTGVLKSESSLTAPLDDIINNNTSVWVQDVVEIRNMEVLSNGALCVITNKGHISYSENGNDWVGGEINIDDFSGSIIHDGNRILTVDKLLNVYESTDNCVSWIRINETTMPANWNSSYLYSQAIVYGNGVYVMTHENGIAVSSDAITWTYQEEGDLNIVCHPYNKIVFGNGKFVLVTTTNSYHSTDGVNWSTAFTTGLSQTTDYSRGNLRFINNLFIVGGLQNSNPHIAYSSDGENWTLSDITPWTISSKEVSDIAYDSVSGTYMVSTTYETYSNGELSFVATSSDLINWSEHIFNFKTNNIYSTQANTRFQRICFVFNKMYGFTKSGICHTSTDVTDWDRTNNNCSISELALLSYSDDINTSYGRTIPTLCHGKTTRVIVDTKWKATSVYEHTLTLLVSNSGFLVNKKASHIISNNESQTYRVAGGYHSNGSFSMVYYDNNSNVCRTYVSADGVSWSTTTHNMYLEFAVNFIDEIDAFCFVGVSYSNSRYVPLVTCKNDQTISTKTVYNDATYGVSITSKPYITDENEIIVMTGYSTGGNSYFVVNNNKIMLSNTNAGSSIDGAYGAGIIIFLTNMGISYGGIKGDILSSVSPLVESNNGLSLAGYNSIDYVGGGFILSGNNKPCLVSPDGYEWHTTVGLSNYNEGFSEIANSMIVTEKTRNSTNNFVENALGFNRKYVGILPYETTKYVRIK